jgi:hypothetical protein
MKTRIAIWAITGLVVVIFWTIYIMATRQHPMDPGSMGRAFICLTCPIALFGHQALSIYLVLIVNAATYALVGAIVETVRQHYKSARFLN